MMKKRLIALVLLTALVLSTLVGCSGSKAAWKDGDGKIDGDLTFWTQDT